MRTCSYILLHGSGELCSRPCRGQYCYIHNAFIKASQKITTLCTECSKPTLSKYSLCTRCKKNMSDRNISKRLEQIMFERECTEEEARHIYIDTVLPYYVRNK